MITDDLQFHIHSGDREAFKQLYAAYAKDIYLCALNVFTNQTDAREVVKKVFISIHQELLEAPGPIDVESRLLQLTNSAISARRTYQTIAAGQEQRASNVWKTQPGFNTTATVPDQSAFVPAPQRSDVLPPSSASVLSSASASPQPSKPAPAGVPMPERQEHARAIIRSAPPRRRGNVMNVLLILLLSLLFIWILVGILMDAHLIPAYDLGYTWFNTQIYPLFAFTKDAA
ncbi:MAG: hypothetical protein RRZ24_05170 [Clostridia bacterium]